MPYQGTYYAQGFSFKQADDDVAINIAGWTFEAQFRRKLDDDEPLLTLTSTGGGFSIGDAPNGRMQMQMTAAQTEDLPVGALVFDVLRTDAVPGPIWLFGGTIKVRKPVTRED